MGGVLLPQFEVVGWNIWGLIMQLLEKAMLDESMRDPFEYSAVTPGEAGLRIGLLRELI